MTMHENQDQAQVEYYWKLHDLGAHFPQVLFPYLSVFRLEQGDILCTQGDDIEHLDILVHGKIKIYTTSQEGKTLILCFKTPLEFIGDVEYINGNDKVINTVEAVSSVHFLRIHRKWLVQYGSEHVPLLQFLLQMMTRKFYSSSNYSRFNLMYPVEIRLASYMLSVACDEDPADGYEELRISSLVDVANLIGTSYRHLNRVIQKLTHDGLVKRTSEYLIIQNRAGLESLAGHNIYE